jgi:hypothetical protein
MAPPADQHGRRLHDHGHRRTIAMTIDDAKQSELTQGERDVLKADTERWQRMGGGAHLDEWLAYYPGLAIRRRLAMKLAHSNRPEGRAYVEAYSQMMRNDGFDTEDKTAMTAFTAVLWLNDQPERAAMLREIRNAMTPGQRSRLNSPISARQRVENALKARAGGTEEKLKGSPLALLKQRVVELERALAEAQARRDGGSLFDLRNDTAAEIGRVVAATISESKAEAIFKASRQHYKQKKQKPAG